LGTDFFEFDKIILEAGHHFKGGCSIEVMEFLGFIDDTGDVETFEDGDLADDFMVGDLFGCKVVMGQMADSLETVRVWNFASCE
jgi:hypothetical protein